MELNVRGRGAEGDSKTNEPSSNFRARAATLKFPPKRIQDRHLTELNKSEMNSHSVISPRTAARLIREEKVITSLSSIRKPEKLQEVSFNSSRNCVAFSTKHAMDISEIEKKLDLKHKQMRESEFRHLGYKTSMNSKDYLEAVERWTKERTLRYEEANRRKELLKDKRENTPRSREDCFSDEEDFPYTYLTKVGRLRKLNYKLLDLSRHPDYIGANNYMSMRQQQYYSPVSRTPEKPYGNVSVLEEGFRVKSVLARNKIECSLKEITGELYSPKLTLLPRGGEGLLAKVCRKN